MTLEIPANDYGAIYVFEVRNAPDALADKTDTALMAVFGQVVLNTDYVDVIAADALRDMTLPQLIDSGYDMPVDEGQKNAMSTIDGTTVLIMSAGFGGHSVNVTLPKGTRLVTVLRETPAIRVIDPLTAQSAEGIIATDAKKPPKSNARMSGMVATFALLAMFALVALMIWVGG
ncbi:MAG: hypothetical protein ACSHW1_04390 [Yoonia sp.]|uniref:hypothetical protein n=1 Tax=Yoonia sp. TaxID=2212373 RepID=UPI003EF3BAF6